jgi:Outer membrane protein beta-barrel domain
MNRALIFAVILSGVTAAPARAQSEWTDRGYVSVSGDVRVSPMSFAGISHPVVFVETATVNTTYDVQPAPGIDGGVGVRVWRNLGVGANVSWIARSSTGSIAAQIPHPFVFNKPRSVSGESTGLDHDETSVHLQAIWMIPAGPRWSVAITGGPSWIVVDQSIVSDVSVVSAYPYDTATFGSAASTRESKGSLGFNIGGDLTWHLGARTGVGFGIVYSQAKVPFATPSGDTMTVTAGGTRVNGGLRVRF